MSASNGNDEILKLLIERVKDAPPKGETEIYNLKNNYGETPLFVGDKNVQLVLLHSGLQNLELSKPDGTTLLWSFTKEMYDTVSLNIISTLRDQVNQRVTIVEDYSRYKVDQVNVGRTPVFGAEHARIVKEFLEAAKKLNIQLDTVMDDGYTLLHNCFKKNIVNPYLIKELVHQRHMRYRGMTPILSVDKFNVESVEEYIRLVDMDVSEQVTLYQHCLDKRMLTHLMAKKLCPALSNKNTRKFSAISGPSKNQICNIV